MKTRATITTISAKEWRKIVYKNYLIDFYTEELADGMTLKEALRRDYEAAGGVNEMIDGGLYEVYYDGARKTLKNIYGEKMIKDWSDGKVWSFYKNELSDAIVEILLAEAENE